jgi:TolB-like protein/predicted Ser/Thr protein kinase/lipoprotein NlpI
MIGKTILHYKILEKLGEGGMGVVYKAEDTKLKRDVAIKFLPGRIAANDEERERFKTEAQAAAALNHPNIAHIYAIEETDDEMFIVMEYIGGKELKEIVEAHRDTPIPIDKIINYATQIAEGLQAAHKKGIVHRDIKSSNIMITDEGKVKIMDFGLAKLSGVGQVTRAGSTLGSPAYMSPEQAKGVDVDHRSDIWSLGTVLYEMLTRQMPFKGDYEQAIIYSILNEAPEHMAGVAPELEQIVLKALAKNPDERYQSADELAADLQAIESGQFLKVKTASKPVKLGYWIAAAVVVLIAIAFYLFKPASQPVPGKENVKTIAVLAFLDLSPNKDQEYFSDGLSDELINVLSKNRNLRVTARTSSFYFKGKDVDIKTIAAKLNVKNILEGSVRKSGNNLRITADLVNVESDATLWSNTYDGKLENIFALQDSISRSVADALKIALLGKENATVQRKSNPEAYNAYLLGKHFYDLRGKENFQKAINYYKLALSIDPNYAPAWVGLSWTHIRQADRAYVPVDEGYRKARQEVNKALALDPILANAYAQVGWIKWAYDWDWSGADSAYQHALELEPGNAVVIRGAATLATTLGRFEEAIRLDRRAIELDPVRVAAYNNLGLHTWYAGYLNESQTAFRKCLQLNPQYPGAHMNIGRVFIEEGIPDSALVEIKKETEPAWQMYGLALAYHALGEEKEADAVLAGYIKEYQNGWAFQIAEIYAYRGNKDKAFEWLERAYRQRDGGLAEMKGDPLLRNIQKDPRYAAFLNKMKLPL